VKLNGANIFDVCQQCFIYGSSFPANQHDINFIYSSLKTFSQFILTITIKQL